MFKTLEELINVIRQRKGSSVEDLFRWRITVINSSRVLNIF